MKMRTWLLVAVLVLATVFALVACDEGVTPPVDEACEHAYASAVTAEPTCAKEGTTTYTCSKCGDVYTEAIAATGEHTYSEAVTTATCAAAGYTTYTCACGDTYTGNTVPATGAHTYTETVVAATCATEGYTTYTCACGDTYKGNTVPATGKHTYTETVVAATCSTEGKVTYTCACGDTYTAATPKVEHSYAAVVTVEPTCTTAGEQSAICESCGHVYHTEILAMLGHSYTGVVTAPTCDTDGYTIFTCGTCGVSYKGDVVSSAGDHSYVTTVLPLTEEQAAANPLAVGVEQKTCALCGAVGEDGEAVLIHLDFENLPEDHASYSGSDNHKSVYSQSSSETFKKLITYLDSQKNLYAWTKTASLVVEDGKMAMTASAFYVFNTLMLGHASPAVSTYTVSFDIIVKKDPATYTKKDRTPIFAIVDEKLSNNMNITLALDKTDVDPDTTDNVHSYQLYAQSYKDGPLKVDGATGYNITLGKEYSIKFAVDSVAKTYHLYIKTVDEAVYTDLGVFDYQPYAQTNRACAFYFAASSSGNGNTFDNFMVTTPLATE